MVSKRTAEGVPAIPSLRENPAQFAWRGFHVQEGVIRKKKPPVAKRGLFEPEISALDRYHDFTLLSVGLHVPVGVGNGLQGEGAVDVKCQGA